MNENVRWYYTDFYIIIYCKLAFFSIKAIVSDSVWTTDLSNVANNHYATVPHPFMLILIKP